MTLDEMIQQCAVDIDETISKTAGVYQGDDLALAKKITTGLNYAYHKICREKHLLTARESVTLDSDKAFQFFGLQQPLIRLFNVYNAAGYHVDWFLRGQSGASCPDLSAGQAVTAEYSYLPPRLTVDALDGSPLIPESKVDHLVLCYYADFYVLNLDPDDETLLKADTFMSLFNNGFDMIRQEISEHLTFRVE